MKLNRARHLLAITIIVVCIAYLLSACDSKLRGAYLSGAHLVGADLSVASLSGAVWNDETVFPEGFEIPEKSET